MNQKRYNRFELRVKQGIATPALYIDLASHGDLFYTKILSDVEKSNKILVIIENLEGKIEGFIREDHPWFNIGLIIKNYKFRMRSHAKMINDFKRYVIRDGESLL